MLSNNWGCTKLVERINPSIPTPRGDRRDKGKVLIFSLFSMTRTGDKNSQIGSPHHLSSIIIITGLTWPVPGRPDVAEEEMGMAS